MYCRPEHMVLADWEDGWACTDQEVSSNMLGGVKYTVRRRTPATYSVVRRRTPSARGGRRSLFKENDVVRRTTVASAVGHRTPLEPGDSCRRGCMSCTDTVSMQRDTSVDRLQR